MGLGRIRRTGPVQRLISPQVALPPQKALRRLDEDDEAEKAPAEAPFEASAQEGEDRSRPGPKSTTGRDRSEELLECSISLSNESLELALQRGVPILSPLVIA